MKNFYFINEQRGGNETPPPTPSPKPKPTPKKPSIVYTQVDIKENEICNGSKEVTKGMKGDIVGYIQIALEIVPEGEDPDYKFGKDTEKAVVNYQLKHKDKGLTVTGKVDKNTFDLLFKGTGMACTKETKPAEVKPDEVKPAEVKPAEVKPTKIKKPMIPSDIKDPIHYRSKIKEQANDYTDMSKLGGNSSDNSVQDTKVESEKTVDKEKTLTPQQILKRVINTGCINSLKEEIGFELFGNPSLQPKNQKQSDGTYKYAIVGFNNEKEEFVYLYSDFTGILVPVDEENKPIPGKSQSIRWECAEFDETKSLTDDVTQMNPNQQKFVDDMVKHGNDYYRTTMPSSYDEGQGAWKRTDLYDVKGGRQYFKEPNKFFVWAKTGVVGKKQGYVDKVIKFIEDSYYTFDEPDVTTPAYRTGVLLKDKFPDYKDYFQPNQMIWYVGPTYSGKEQEQVGSLVKDIVADAKQGGTKLKRKFCRGGVDVLYDASKNPTKTYFAKDSDLQIVKDYVKRCVSKLEPNAISDVLGGSRSKFDYLMTRRAGTQGSLRFMLGEQKNNLNSLIKKKLVEAKTKKENDTIGKQLIENRLKMIVESIKKQGNIVEKKNLEKVSLEFINELKELNNQGLINENLSDSLKNIFGTGLETMPQKFFEVIFDRILTKLGLNDVALKNALVDSSKNNPTEIVNSFKDCESMTELIAKTITDILYMNLQSEKNLKGQGWNLIRNILGQEIKKEEFLKNIKTNLNNAVCQEFSNLTSNSQNLLSKIKGATI
jgi:hypothetical protein